MINKRYKIFLVFFISLIIVFFIIYKLVIYTPHLLDYGQRNLVEKTIDFLCFGWHFTKASIYSDYLKNNEKANRELGKAGWYGKKYFVKKFEVDGEDSISILEVYKNLNITSILEDLYIFLMKEEDHEIGFFHEAGEIFMISKNWKMATEAFSKVVDSNPNDVMSYYYLSLSYLNLKRLNKANNYVERVIELEPDFADVYFRLGVSAEKKKNRMKAKSLYEMAAKAFSKIIESNPDDVRSHYYLGLNYFYLRKLDKASEYFERTIELKLDFADAYFRLGIIAEKKKDRRKAKSLYEKAINILPNHIEGLKALKKINKKLK